MDALCVCPVDNFSIRRNEKKNRKTEINAVDDISLTVREGEIVGILGPNGAGRLSIKDSMDKILLIWSIFRSVSSCVIP